MVKKKTRPIESEDEDDPETLARIKHLERGRQGFSPIELAKLKYSDNMEQIKHVGVPFNPKLDSIS